MYQRLADVTVDMLSEGTVSIVSTHNIVAPPGFEQVWHAFGSGPGMTPATQLPPLIEGSDVCLIFSDTKCKDHMACVSLISDSSLSLGAAAPPLILMSHSMSPEKKLACAVVEELTDDNADAEFRARSTPLDHGVDEFISMEYSGIRLVCEIRTRIEQQHRIVARAMKKVDEVRERTTYVDELRDVIHDMVWQYLRVRLHTGIPQVDYDIDPGVPSVIDGCVVGGVLGQGSFGMVHKLTRFGADGSWMCTEEALKMVDKAAVTNCSGIASLKRQVNVMQLLSSGEYEHPNIAKLYAIHHTGTHVLFRMEYGGPVDLFKFLVCYDRDVCQEIRKFSSIMSQCMSAICHLHLRPKVVHRDIKPENIILSETDGNIVVKLADFDTACRVTRTTPCRGCIGTFPFMAPEVVLDSSYSPFPADVWSMGAVFLEVMCRVGILAEVTNTTKPATKAQAQYAAGKIVASLGQPGFIDALLQNCVREGLEPLLSDAQGLLKGMLYKDVEKRWTAKDLQDVAGKLFIVP